MGTGVISVYSDLTSIEVPKFLQASEVTYREVLELHKKLKKESLWNLLHKNEAYLEKKQKL